jgi:hypothetical protein
VAVHPVVLLHFSFYLAKYAFVLWDFKLLLAVYCWQDAGILPSIIRDQGYSIIQLLANFLRISLSRHKLGKN